MTDLLEELIWGFSFIYYLVLYLFQGLKRVITCMALTLNSPPSSNISSLPSNLSWVGQLFVEPYGTKGPLVTSDHGRDHKIHNLDGKSARVVYINKHGEEDHNLDGMSLQAESHKQDQNRRRFHHQMIQSGAGRSKEIITIMKEKKCNEIDDLKYCLPEQEGSVGVRGGIDCEAIGVIKLRKRPARLVVPEYLTGQEFCQKGRTKKLEKQEFEVEGRDFFLAAKKGRREAMEDGYGVLLDIMGDPKQVSIS